MSSESNIELSEVDRFVIAASLRTNPDGTLVHFSPESVHKVANTRSLNAHRTEGKFVQLLKNSVDNYHRLMELLPEIYETALQTPESYLPRHYTAVKKGLIAPPFSSDVQLSVGVSRREFDHLQQLYTERLGLPTPEFTWDPNNPLAAVLEHVAHLERRANLPTLVPDAKPAPPQIEITLFNPESPTKEIKPQNAQLSVYEMHIGLRLLDQVIRQTDHPLSLRLGGNYRQTFRSIQEGLKQYNGAKGELLQDPGRASDLYSKIQAIRQDPMTSGMANRRPFTELVIDLLNKLSPEELQQLLEEPFQL